MPLRAQKKDWAPAIGPMSKGWRWNMEQWCCGCRLMRTVNCRAPASQMTIPGASAFQPNWGCANCSVLWKILKLGCQACSCHGEEKILATRTVSLCLIYGGVPPALLMHVETGPKGSVLAAEAPFGSFGWILPIVIWCSWWTLSQSQSQKVRSSHSHRLGDWIGREAIHQNHDDHMTSILSKTCAVRGKQAVPHRAVDMFDHFLSFWGNVPHLQFFMFFPHFVPFCNSHTWSLLSRSHAEASLSFLTQERWAKHVCSTACDPFCISMGFFLQQGTSQGTLNCFGKVSWRC